MFQVTDTELQAISKQGPDGHRIVQIEHDNEVETVYVIDPGIQDREELVGEPEVKYIQIYTCIILIKCHNIRTPQKFKLTNM